MWPLPRWSLFPICTSGSRCRCSACDLITWTHREDSKTPRNSHSGTRHCGTWRPGNPDTPERDTAETGDPGTRTPRDGTPRKQSVRESGHGEWGSWPPTSEGCAAAAAMYGRFLLGAALTAHSESTGLTARWPDGPMA